MVELSIIAAFIAGFLSFLSPCIMPLIPAFLGYLVGVNPNSKSPKVKIKMFVNSVFFVLGFSFIFAGLGVLLHTILRTNSYQTQLWLSRLGGIAIIIFGLYILKLIKIPFLEKEHKLQIKGLQLSYFTSFIFGAAFAVGWSPCVGAILGTILTLALTNPGQSFYLLFAYSLGLGIPFLIIGLFSTQAIHLINKNESFLKYFNIIVGIFLLILGILVFTQKLGMISNFNFI